ncbi:MAG: ABC transporter ATP-binding protein [Brevibacterium aurantiacum]|uniref:ABC transporter ATP-binding protein n=1 Tax=Brevibacterium aurantiacum TaxID=273384 RepID=UPI003F922584
MIDVSNLCKTFRGPDGGPGVVACDSVSFSVARGQTLGLVGESGSGKSTIARILMGLETPDSGRILIAGADRSHPARGRRERLDRARSAQMVFQDPGGSLDPRVSILDSLVRAMRVHGISDRSEARRMGLELLEKVRLSGRVADARPHELSGGQRQRSAIARALAVSPQVLVLDEAVSALDVSVQAQVLELLRELSVDMGLTSLFVSHDLAVVESICDEVMVLHRGMLVESGPAAEVLRSPQHPYTRLLIASTPSGPDWKPEEVSQLRLEFGLSHVSGRRP